MESPALIIPNFIIYILGVWSYLAIIVKRCQDLDRSGWYILINLIPIIGVVHFFIKTHFTKGTERFNGYGQNPIVEGRTKLFRKA